MIDTYNPYNQSNRELKFDFKDDDILEKSLKKSLEKV